MTAMDADLTVITPTGARLDAFRSCNDCMLSQDFKGQVKWIVVDDGVEPVQIKTPKGFIVLHIRRSPFWQPGENTQAINMQLALDNVHSDTKLVIVEDDDLYAPWWLSACFSRLDEFDLIGETPSLYREFHSGQELILESRRKPFATLATVACKAAGLELLKDTCLYHRGSIDLGLWGAAKALNYKVYQPSPRGVIGVKNRGGRAGLGQWHNPKDYQL